MRVAKLTDERCAAGAGAGERQGFMRGSCRWGDDRILGFTMIGADAGEVMAAVQTAMLADLPY